MSKINLKENIFIEGGNSYNEINRIDTIIGHKHLYIGRTSEISEELAKKYFYYGYDDLELHYESLKESIQSACPEEFCVIYKEK